MIAIIIFNFLNFLKYFSNFSSKLNEIIKEKVKNHYKSVESAWNEVDISNSNEMNKEMMWKLFKK
jgi:hypothetical protein